MKQAPSPVDELIQRFRNNECTPEEIELLQQWLTQLDLSDELTDLSPEQLAAAKSRMYQQLVSARPIAMHRQGFPYRKLLTAASWLLLIVSAAVLYYYIRPTSIVPQGKQPVFTVIENKHNGIRRITLPDGSQVCLNINSRLEFDPEQFNSTERLVKLSGEGFFEVMPAVSQKTHQKIPFVVATGNLRTRVLGTAFNIEAYDQESEVRVSLVHGKIALDDTTTAKTTILDPNQAIRYSKQNQSWEVLPVDAASVAMWTSGQLVFNEVPLAEAIGRISQRYQVAIDFKPELMKGKRITASFKNTDWKTALGNVLFVHGMKYKQVGDRVVILKLTRS